jgi:hypothetical protein
MATAGTCNFFVRRTDANAGTCDFFESGTAAETSAGTCDFFESGPAAETIVGCTVVIISYKNKFLGLNLYCQVGLCTVRQYEQCA